MRKLKLYLDTSVISHVEATHKPIEESVTRRFFEVVRERGDEFEMVISPVGVLELENSAADLRSRFFDFLATLDYNLLPENVEADQLAGIYRQEGVLAAHNIRDLTHMAYAVVARCDYIISWNMKHLVNVRTISRINAVNEMHNYHSINIVTPAHIIGDPDDDNS